MKISQSVFTAARVRIPLLLPLAGVLLLGLIAFVVVQSRPSVALAKRQASLIDGIERRSPARIRRLVSGNYSDRWSFDREEIVTAMVDIGSQFLSLELTPEELRWKIEKSEGAATMRLVVGGRAIGPAATEVMRRVNQLEEPFVFTWRKESFLPSGWRLVSVENTSLPDDLHGYEPGDIRRAMQGE